MTKRQRAQVVELLRCAFDESHSIMETSHELDADPTVRQLVIDARVGFFNVIREAHMAPRDYYDECLEAAQRVEEGSWP